MAVTKKSLLSQFKKSWKKYYALEIFKDRSFVRKKCSKCKRFFWASDKKRRKCGDSSCESYSFIGKKIGKAHDYVDTWREFAKFFAEHRRTIIPRYPTMARWRDDTWFTQASIYCFQPYVVSGEVRPPANTLVMAQPCFRFNDIENVGVTSRHYSGFVMLGQHNFISEKYGHITHWKDGDIGLLLDCLEHFKIKSKEITFVESAWVGGGNSGPAFEVFCRGLELLTAVFMQFENTSKGIKEIPLKIVDFGWGLERLAWLLNGTPTSYEVTFDPVDKKWIKKLGLKFNSSLMKKFIINSGILNFDEVKNIDKTWKTVAKKCKVKLEKLKKEVEPYIAFYSILDHSRTLLFALADGAIPSNSGGGYNLRFILRRSLRLAEKYGWDIDLKELVRDHANAFSGKYRPRHVHSTGGRELLEVDKQPMFPELIERLPNVEKILEVEERKYNETKLKTKAILESVLQKKKTIKEEELIKLYDSQGILPEDVVQAATKYKVKVKVPADFYSKIAASHTERKPVKPKVLINVKKIPATRPLYYDDEKLREFDAHVLACIDKKYVALDKTAFFPQSGGQISDTGKLNNANVLAVQKIGEVVLHTVDTTLRENEFVVGKIDWDRRFAIMKNHTATHVINGVARRVLGEHIWQTGSEVTSEKARLDITHFSTLTREDLQKIEQLANKVVAADLPVRKTIYKKDVAESKFGFRLYQGGAVPGDELRVVEIPGFDVEACGGTHVRRTGEIGFIKILDSKRIQDGVIRLEFVAGLKALEEIQKLEETLAKASEVFSVPKDMLVKTCERFFKEWKDLRKQIDKLRQKR